MDKDRGSNWRAFHTETTNVTKTVLYLAELNPVFLFTY